MIQELSEHTDSMWYCRGCNFKSKMKCHVYEHVESKHISDGRFYYCPYCGNSLRARHHVRAHILRHHKGKSCSVKDIYGISK